MVCSTVEVLRTHGAVQGVLDVQDITGLIFIACNGSHLDGRIVNQKHVVDVHIVIGASLSGDFVGSDTEQDVSWVVAWAIVHERNGEPAPDKVTASGAGARERACCRGHQFVSGIKRSVGNALEIGIAMDESPYLGVLAGASRTEANPYGQRVGNSINGCIETVVGTLGVVVVPSSSG